MKTEDKDKLGSLFQEMKLNEPSVGFESRLMQHIYAVEKKQSRKINIKSILAIFGGIMGILGIPALIFYLSGVFTKTDIQLSKYEFKLSLPEIHFDPLVISIASVALLLLISDTLIRKRIWEKKQKN